MHYVAGNTKLVTLSDAVKLAVDGNLQIPGSIILTLKKYYKVKRERKRERERERETLLNFFMCTFSNPPGQHRRYPEPHLPPRPPSPLPPSRQ
jgi:hypothetical protein